ncbi:MAG TPA: hypothetical protein DCW90_00310 [Lachnospiraceae bacterium]|nr:hypothetical protein [Lachnospiraceae bacterium]
MNLYAFPITKDERRNGKGGWLLIKNNPDRLVSVDNIKDDIVDITTIVTLFDTFIVINNKVYESFKKYIDPDNKRLIYMVSEVGYEADVEPPKKDQEEEDKS